MKTEVIHYLSDDISFKGYLAKPDNIQGKLPAVLVAHAWRGQDDFARQKAEELAALGYIGFAVDMYGNGTVAKDNEEALQLMLPLFLNREFLRQRINIGLEALRQQIHVDLEAIGAIGFCFGGLTVIELLRSGANIKGAVSFHGVLGSNIDKFKAKLAPNDKIKGSLLILHGYLDPLVSHTDVMDIQNEMTKAGVDWQMNIYGKALHAFTNPQANESNIGLVYNQQAAKRSWLDMTNFFNEIFETARKV